MCMSCVLVHGVCVCTNIFLLAVAEVNCMLATRRNHWPI